MGFEVWIVIVLAASGLAGWLGFALAKKGAPKQSELDAMAAELDEARQQAESVQTNVSEHFEQSAMLFGKLAADYREFLDHFESSAQNLGLSEARARELIEQGFQPLLTHEESDGPVVAEAESQAEAAEENVDTTHSQVAEAGASEVEASDMETAEAESKADLTSAQESSAEYASAAEDSAEKTEQKTAGVGEITVDLPDDAEAPQDGSKTMSTDADAPVNPERQRA